MSRISWYRAKLLRFVLPYITSFTTMLKNQLAFFCTKRVDLLFSGPFAGKTALFFVENLQFQGKGRFPNTRTR